MCGPTGNSASSLHSPQPWFDLTVFKPKTVKVGESAAWGNRRTHRCSVVMTRASNGLRAAAASSASVVPSRAAGVPARTTSR